MKKSFNAVIIHGSFGTPDGNWFPWLAHQLELKGVKAVRPELPTPNGQSLRSWMDVFHKQVKGIGSNTILIGHSLASAFILHILQSLKTPVHSTVLVSPFIRELGLYDFDTVNKSFIDGPFNWEKIKLNAGKTSIFGGDNDPYVPIEAMEEVSEFLGISIKIIKNGGHLNTSSGYTTFPEVYDEIIENL